MRDISCSASWNTEHFSLLMDQVTAAAAIVHRHLCLPWEAKFICPMRNVFLEACCSQDIPATCRASTEAPPWDAAGRAVKAESSQARRGEVLLGNICGRH